MLIAVEDCRMEISAGLCIGWRCGKVVLFMVPGNYYRIRRLCCVSYRGAVEFIFLLS